jgi:hypothetical protein
MKVKAHRQQTHIYIKAVKTDLENLATSHVCTVNHKSRKFRLCHLSQTAQVALQRELRKKPPKLLSVRFGRLKLIEHNFRRLGLADES